MTMMKRIIFALFLLGLHLISAQEITVMDLDSREPILNVAIYNLDKSKTAVSDFDGKCDLSIFDRNERITFQHISYEISKATKAQIQPESRTT